MLASGEIGEQEYRELWHALESDDRKTWARRIQAPPVVDEDSPSKDKRRGAMILSFLTALTLVFVFGIFIAMNIFILPKFAFALEETGTQLSTSAAGSMCIYKLAHNPVVVTGIGLFFLAMVAVLIWTAVSGSLKMVGVMVSLGTLLAGALVLIAVIQVFSMYIGMALAI